MGEACLTSHSAPATTALATMAATAEPTAVLTHTATAAGTLRPLTLRQRPLPPPRMAMATHMAATVLATTVVPTDPTHTPLTPAMATATHTRVPVPMLVMLVPMVPMVVPTLVMAMATHTPPPPPLATMDAATATHTTIRLSSDVAHEGCSRCASLELGTRM